MPDLTGAYEALGRPQSSAQAFVEGLGQERPVILPIIDTNSVRLSLHHNGQIEEVNFATSASARGARCRSSIYCRETKH